MFAVLCVLKCVCCIVFFGGVVSLFVLCVVVRSCLVDLCCGCIVFCVVLVLSCLVLCMIVL